MVLYMNFIDEFSKEFLLGYRTLSYRKYYNDQLDEY